MLYILPFEDLPQNPTPNNPIKFKCLQMRVINPDSPELLPPRRHTVFNVHLGGKSKQSKEQSDIIVRQEEWLGYNTS